MPAEESSKDRPQSYRDQPRFENSVCSRLRLGCFTLKGSNECIKASRSTLPDNIGSIVADPKESTRFEDLGDDLTLVQRGSFGASLKWVNQPGVIQPQSRQNGCMQTVDVDFPFNRVHSKIVRRADGLPASDAATREPHRESVRIVVTAVTFLTHRSSPKFAAPDHQSFFQKPSLLEVIEERRDRPIRRRTEIRMVLFDAGVRVPPATRSRVKLDEANAAFHQSPCQQTISAERLRPLIFKPIRIQGRFGFLREIDRLGSVRLHLKRQFVRGDPGLQLAVTSTVTQMITIELIDVIELPSLACLADTRGRIQVQNRLASQKKFRSLVRGWHES